MERSSGVILASEVKDNGTAATCSGILLDEKWIITVGSLLSSIDRKTKDGKLTWLTLMKIPSDRLVPVPKDIVQKLKIDFRAVIPTYDESINSLNMGHNSFCVRQDSKEILTPMREGKSQAVSSDQNEKSTEYSAELCYVWRSSLMSEAVHTLLKSWLLGYTSSGKENSDLDAESEVAKQLLSLFVILKIRERKEDLPERDNHDAVVQTLYRLFESQECVLQRGQTTIVESTPFGNSLFVNSVSEGVISNIVGPKGCLLLTDARTAMGSEGGSVYVINDRKHRQRAGMVVCSMSWCKGEWMGFTLGVVWQPILQKLMDLDMSADDIHPISVHSKNSDFIGMVDGCIVLVRCGSGWGSGIVLDSRQGIILTCSHVVRKCEENNVEIYWKGIKSNAKVIFRSRDGIAFDAAVLKTNPAPPFRQAVLSNSLPVKGEPVVAAGFPLFSEDDNSLPTVTRGIIAHVSTPLAMLQTTCCVQSGASGGAIFNNLGEVVGLINCNTHTSAGAIYPRINMAVPVLLLFAPLQHFLVSGDSKYLKYFESNDPAVQKIWKLQSPISKL